MQTVNFVKKLVAQVAPSVPNKCVQGETIQRDKQIPPIALLSRHIYISCMVYW